MTPYATWAARARYLLTTPGLSGDPDCGLWVDAIFATAPRRGDPIGTMGGRVHTPRIAAARLRVERLRVERLRVERRARRCDSVGCACRAVERWHDTPAQALVWRLERARPRLRAARYFLATPFLAARKWARIAWADATPTTVAGRRRRLEGWVEAHVGHPLAHFARDARGACVRHNGGVK